MYKENFNILFMLIERDAFYLIPHRPMPVHTGSQDTHLLPVWTFSIPKPPPDMTPDTTCGKPGGLIHHSDRDIQYAAYPSYTHQPKEHHAAISMTGNRGPPENTMTGRVNGISNRSDLTRMNPKTSPCAPPTGTNN
jgi:hypothetical protein